MKISVETVVKAKLNRVRDAWNAPADIIAVEYRSG